MSTSPSADPAAARRWLRGYLRPLLAAVVLVSLVTTPSAWMLDMRISAQQSRNAVLTAEIRRLELQIKDVASLHGEIEDLTARRTAAAQWQVQRQWPARLLRLLAESRPEGVRFDEVLDTAEGLRLSGRAHSYGEVAELAATLGRSSLVSWIDVAALEQERVGGLLSFALNTRLDTHLRPLERPQTHARVGGPVGDPK